ncbi:MAG: GNAT family N-acetyltransferase [Kastovskya adunca ATA6-11-RM4]|nr:GNAT family N-acetyltransferase [Kastovskya adunca ATA6-11-RM4]
MQIKTSRLILREFIREDFQQLAPLLANPQVMKFSTIGRLSVSQTQAKVESFISSYSRYGFGKWAVVLKESKDLIGYCGIAVEIIDDQEEKELGYRLDEKYWGRGLATEAASAALEYGLNKLEIAYILGVVERENIASVKVLKKIGMKYEKKTVFQGVSMDVYRIEKEKPSGFQ